MSAVSATSRHRASWVRTIASRAQVEAPALADWLGAVTSSLLLILSFPNFELAPLAWVGLVPLLVVIARRPHPVRALILGWTTGTIFFYGSCYWLTYSMIHYGGLPPVVAYLLLIPGAIVVGLFPGLFAVVLAIAIRRWGSGALLLSPVVWVAFEYARLGVTGQLWNAIGYSQAFFTNNVFGLFTEPARWGGVYATGALIIGVNAAVALVIVSRSRFNYALAAALLVLVLVTLVVSFPRTVKSGPPPFAHVIAVQPNVPMNLVRSAGEDQQLLQRHLSLTTQGLAAVPEDKVPRLVVWPESPMYFAYSSDPELQQLLQSFARERKVSLLLNSQEPAPTRGIYNSALLINEDGRMISQYDKIRLLPFGEYVPLPRWLPGASLITAIVGDFTPGANYTLMPIGANKKMGVFICVESAYPSIARALTNGGADVLVNISNDGYLGPTAVMRQHLANAVFRAVENGRPVLRVTNSGITAEIRADGFIQDQTEGFQPAVRLYSVNEALTTETFYSKHGDVFVQGCSVISLLVLVIAIAQRQKGIAT
ncbi:MAG TPA: apolipoprotein N-acyltransferase [Pyrinomonadaceae bacterium]|nr:apolipoprotein N-acyltransferase [Pyrinomonadaceae bacterium]